MKASKSQCSEIEGLGMSMMRAKLEDAKKRKSEEEKKVSDIIRKIRIAFFITIDAQF